jgi:hypothetical protein
MEQQTAQDRPIPRVRVGLVAMTVVVLLLLVGAARPALSAAVFRNLGQRLLVAGIVRHGGSCTEIPLATVDAYLTRAMALQPDAMSPWRTLLLVKGLGDRLGVAPLAGAPGALLAEESLLPPSWAMPEEWSAYRCLNAWRAWTLGLVEAANGHWERAVAAYQAGLGLAPGRVPPEIVQEYYLARARYSLSAGELSPAQELTAAKYLALAGAANEAAVLFQNLGREEQLAPDKRCQAARWLDWLGQAKDAEDVTPPGPRTKPGQGGACEGETEPAALPEAEWSPEWVLSPDKQVSDPATGRVLLGFDLDPDVLEAGAEVLGVLYWRGRDGQVEAQTFRQPNLWPNSGNSWLRLEGFSTCLPGYAEPPWVPPCASRATLLPGEDGTQNPVGIIHVPPAEGPDTLIATASARIPKDQPIVYGGWWWLDGNLPRAQMARYGEDNGDPRAYYEVVLDLSDLLPEQWQARTGITPPLPWDHDFQGWIRPRNVVGHGDLEFDDLFSFVLPGQE